MTQLKKCDGYLIWWAGEQSYNETVITSNQNFMFSLNDIDIDSFVNPYIITDIFIEDSFI